LLTNPAGLAHARKGQIATTTMTGGAFGHTCAAHNCLKPRWKEGWCAAHWYAHEARLHLYRDAEDDELESIAICEAIWNAS
jgi:hypothetical protein